VVPSRRLEQAQRVLAAASAVAAPSFLRLEALNATYRLARRGLASVADVEDVLTLLAARRITFLDSDRWTDGAVVTATRYKQPHIYDAIYLACAEDLDAELWTCDARFVRSVRG
jgi:predicted nucleic acid-binding protein